MVELVGEPKDFPKYTTQILNLCSRNAQATRPSVVGKMSDLIQECPYRTYKGWRQWYLSRKPEAILEATKRIKKMLNNIKDALPLINDELIHEWVEDLVIAKSFTGLRCQQAILARLAKMKDTTSKIATPEEESKGIDGYIGRDPVSIKPDTYKSQQELPESIRIPIIYYEKLKNGIKVDAGPFLAKKARLY
jgi:hypothetical protein